MPNSVPPMVALGKRTKDSDPINLTNAKPFRSTALKYEARKNAVKNHKGYYTSNTPCLYHGEYKA